MKEKRISNVEQGMSNDEGKEKYPMSNKECRMMKEKARELRMQKAEKKCRISNCGFGIEKAVDAETLKMRAETRFEDIGAML